MLCENNLGERLLFIRGAMCTWRSNSISRNRRKHWRWALDSRHYEGRREDTYKKNKVTGRQAGLSGLYSFGFKRPRLWVLHPEIQITRAMTTVQYMIGVQIAGQTL
jgi:hypothetical protein